MRLSTMFLKLSMYILLYIVMTTASPNDDNTMAVRHSDLEVDFDFQTSYHYDVKISLMPGYVSHGESTIVIYIHSYTQFIRLLTSDYVEVTKAYLRSEYTGKIYVPIPLNIVMKDYVVLDFTKYILPENSLELGFYTLNVHFSNPYTDELWQTWYTDEEENKKFIATLFQSTKRLRIFPCFHISELVTFNISVEHDKRYQVLSNMPIRNQSVSNDVMLTHFHIWHHTSYIYEVALILMCDMTPLNPITYNSDLIPDSKITFNMWSRSHLVPHMKFPQHVLENVIKYLDDNWNIMRRGPKVDCVVIPNFNGNINQTWGLLIYNETYITYNEELNPAYKGTVMRLITHEIIYQWFNGFFYPWCTHSLLNEGFIEFVETYIIDEVFPNSGIMNLFIIQDQHEYRYMDIHFPSDIYGYFTKSASKINSLSIRQRIIRPIVWRMIESVIPNNVFWESINTYLKTVAIYRNTTVPDNLCDIMRSVGASAIKNYKINIKQMTNVWAEQKYCPTLNAIRDYNGAYVNITIDEKQRFNQTFFIPIYPIQMNIDFNTKSSTIDHHYLTESNPELKIPIKNKDQWVIIDEQHTGYYRVNYDLENWQRITRYLNSKNYINIHVLNRAQIIDDAFHLAMEKKLNFSIFWNLASYLPRREKDYIAWYPMIKAFEYLSNYFAIISVSDKNLSPLLKEVSMKIKEMLKDKKEHIYTSLYKDIFNQIKLVEDDFNKYLKLDIAKWGCLITNNLCMEMAKNKLELYVLNNTLNKILPGLEEWTYCNGLKTANVSMWFTVYYMASNMYKENSDYKMLKYLGCSENSTIIDQYLWTVIPEFKQGLLRENDHNMFKQKNKDKINSLINNMFLSTLARHAKDTLILKGILRSLEINYSPVSMTTTLNVLINNVYTEQLLTEIREFAKTHMSSIDYKYIDKKLMTRSYKLFDQVKFFNDMFK